MEAGGHLLNWDTLTKPKRLGGANLKPARDMNCAMLAKLAWRVLNCSGLVWSKHGVKEEDVAYLKGRRSQI